MSAIVEPTVLETIAAARFGLEGLLRQLSRAEAFRVGLQLAQLRQQGMDPFPIGSRLHGLAGACVVYSVSASEDSWSVVRGERDKVRAKR